MTDPRCDRPQRHHEHDYVDEHGVDRRCPGTKQAHQLPELLAERPGLAEVGLVPRVIQLGVMSA